MKNTLLVFVLIALLLASTSSALAYGGGGFPPGYWENLKPRQKLVCGPANVKLPFGRTAKIPTCRIVRVSSERIDLSERMNSFFDRVINGRK